jgi:glycine dehydrogenase subunit 1
MLQTIGASSVEDLFVDVPEAARLGAKVEGLPDHASEMAVERQLSAMARRNLAAGDAPFFLGCGAYKHHIPASVDHLIQRGEFLTSYTPYQPEIAQGTLQALFEFQTQVARLYGCDVANASMYDGSTACWEAIGMARRITRRTKAILSGGLHPHYVSVANTMAKFTGDTLETSLPELGPEPDTARLLESIDKETSCVVVQYPDILGRIGDLSELAERAHAMGALLIAVVTEPVALGLLRPPGEMGADIVVGEGQAIGEQHIRREKATSNICTNSGLCALAFSIHMTLLGEKGLRGLAALNHARAVQAAERLAKVPGVELVSDTFFNEFTLRLPKEARPVVRAMAEKGVLGGVSLGRLYPGAEALERGLVIAVTETNTQDDIEALARALEEALA